MRMIYGNTPVKTMNVRHYEISTNDCNVVPSDLQAGVTCFAKGQKITGTGKAFSFATYGNWFTNESVFIPTVINTIQIGSLNYPVRMTVPMNDMVSHDFTTAQKMAEVIIDGVAYPMVVSVQNGEFIITCDKTIEIELFMGRDEYA